jgi:hypothetical protein
MEIIAHIASFISIWLLYAFSLFLIGNITLFLSGVTGSQFAVPICIAMGLIPGICASVLSIVGTSTAMNSFGYTLSLIPVIIYSVMILTGISKDIARSIAVKKTNLVDEGHYILTGDKVLTDADRVKYKFTGQLIGTLIGLPGGIFLHYNFIV